MNKAWRGNDNTVSLATPFPLSSVALGVCALFALYFLGMGSYPLFDPDEPVYGQVAREMANGAGWLSPHLNGALWFDKPPLFYWLSALSVSLFGPTEFACRLPSALGAVGLVWLVFLWARHDFGARAAFLSALVMATCFQQIVLARAAVTDMTLAFFLTAALYSYRRWLDEAAAHSRAQRAWSLACGAATGLAMLTKGPVAPLLLSVTFLIHGWWNGHLRLLRSASAMLAVTMALLVGLPWYVAMFFLHGQAFVQGFLVANNITRFLKAEHATQTGRWYSIFFNVPILIGFFFPWSVFLPQAIARLWRDDGREGATVDSSAPGARLALVWLSVVFAFFSLSKTLLVTYIFPLYPAAALLVGTLWNEAESDAPARRGVRGGLWTALLLSALLAAGLTSIAHQKFPRGQTAALITGLILMLVCGAALVVMSRRDKSDMNSPLRAARVMGTGMALLAAWLVVGVVPRIPVGPSTRDLVMQLPAQPAQVADFDVRVPSLSFYLSLRPGNRYLGSLSEKQVHLTMGQSAPVFVVCRQKDADKIGVPGAGEWTSSGKLVVLANAAGMALRQKGTHAP